MSAKEPILQVAAKALIVNSQGQVLLAREAKTGPNNTQIGFYGLIGGRLEPGETFFDGLRREVMEEVGLEVEPDKPLYVGEWHPTIHGVAHQIIAVYMLCHVAKGDVRLSEEHDTHEWIDPLAYTAYNMMTPDDRVIELYNSLGRQA